MKLNLKYLLIGGLSVTSLLLAAKVLRNLTSKARYLEVSDVASEADAPFFSPESEEGGILELIGQLPLDLRKSALSLLTTTGYIELTRDMDIRTPSGGIEYSLGDGIAHIRDSRLSSFMDNLIALGGGISQFYNEQPVPVISDGYKIEFCPIDKDSRSKHTIRVIRV